MSPSLRLNCGNRLCDERLRSLQGDSPVPIQTTASIQGPGWKNQVQTVHTVKKKLHHGIHGITAEGCRWTEHNGGYRFRFCVTQLEKYVVVVVSCHPRFLVPWNRQRKLQWSVLSLNLFMFVCHCSNVQAIAFVTFTRSESGKWKKWSMCYKNYIRIT